MRNLTIAVLAATTILFAAPAATKVVSASTSTDITCSDGTISPSKNRQGACRGHGGIAETTTTKTKTMATPAGKTESMTMGTGKAKTTTTTTAPVTPMASGIMCKDGTQNPSSTRQGACRGHGGIAPAMPAKTKSMATPAGDTTSMTTSSHGATTTTTTSVAPSAASSTKTMTSTSAGAHTAQCKDGSYSDSRQHSGACSHHGGVKAWLDGK